MPTLDFLELLFSFLQNDLFLHFNLSNSGGSLSSDFHYNFFCFSFFIFRIVIWLVTFFFDFTRFSGNKKSSLLSFHFFIVLKDICSIN